MGLVTGVVLGRLMSAALPGVVSLDPETFMIVSVALAIVSMAAAYVPARRTLRLDPASILRAN
jgi:ABC-type antimicrobial peptide transport system permease subunit